LREKSRSPNTTRNEETGAGKHFCVATWIVILSAAKNPAGCPLASVALDSSLRSE
jgi:hypothetical protein